MSRCTCLSTLTSWSFAPDAPPPPPPPMPESVIKSLPINLSLILFITSTALVLRTSLASPCICEIASFSSFSLNSLLGGLGIPIPLPVAVPAPPAVLAILSEALPVGTPPVLFIIDGFPPPAAAAPAAPAVPPPPVPPAPPPAVPPPPPTPPPSVVASAVLRRRQLIKGSWTKASSMAVTLSLFPRRTRMTFSHVFLKLPSIPLTSIALIIIRVNRKGTLSGNFSRFMDASKQSPKSMCNSLPLYLSSIRLLGWRSPKPRIYPTIDITAVLRV
mmetsp:Transcript_7060/g.13910  ORF Transcript_7060/g.13910 Transcript_7060/m.13910 type:complete len:273 (+) Transcript_7060:184-1002(+)